MKRNLVTNWDIARYTLEEILKKCLDIPKHAFMFFSLTFFFTYAFTTDLQMTLDVALEVSRVTTLFLLFLIVPSTGWKLYVAIKYRHLVEQSLKEAKVYVKDVNSK